MNKVIVVGYSGHAFVAIDILLNNGHEILGYCDVEQKAYDPYSLPYLGKEIELFNNAGMDLNDTSFFIGIGHNGIRRKIYGLLQTKNVTIINAIHAQSIIAKNVSIGNGVLIAANAIINPLCSIGNAVICNTSSVIDHECTIGEFSHICPGTVLCGNVAIGNNCFIGANSVVKQGVEICNEVVIGAGSTVVKNITLPGTYFGNVLRSR